MSEATGPGLGHNEPPDPIADLRERLEAENQDVLGRAEQLLSACRRMPLAVEDEQVAAAFSDQIMLLHKCARVAEDRHKLAKEPHLLAGRAVDGFFKRRIIEPMQAAAEEANRKLTAYHRAKAERERRAREAEAAEAAERERQERALAAAALAAADTDASLERAIDAEGQARLAEAAAADAKRAADAKAADLSRTRGEYGSTASLRGVWKGEVEDKATLDLEPLRPYLTPDSLQKAINAFVRAGGRALRGAKIFEDFKTTVR